MNRFLTVVIAGLTLAACQTAQGGDESFRMDVVGQQFVASGVIDGTTPAVVQRAISAHPHITELVLNVVPGSDDDDANLRAARLVRSAGLTTIVPEGGMVASGGTDLFLAGEDRVIGPGACLGVHSWASQSMFGGRITQGRDVPRDSGEHDVYLDYYAEMGIDGAFYWYTLDAADADGIHWMSNAEIQRFGLATAPLSGTEANPQRCDIVE